ncbi:hypothetical protein C8046_11700 [Serinibacter arcticus]|uniref:Uncharacterized protein n=1 Tax=Serinibacter arcticus TaxID=1655435 RepID=A0A2U1ZW47_9MICO|nr:hypothetical protein [Serinibacter arcticus]PWD51217.1 hypothetical protein C8046_11700 [Serinibacter arcticus]
MTAKCPQCFHDSQPGLGAYQCARACTRVHNPGSSKVLGYDVYLPPGLRWSPPQDRKRAGERPECPRCKGPARPACQTCNFAFPDRWLEGSTACIALAGPRSTGKSVYIAVLVKELTRLAISLGGMLQAQNEYTQRQYEYYEHQLFKERHLIPATRPMGPRDGVHAPLIYSLGVIAGRERFVAIRDVAGEDLEQAAVSRPEWLTFLGRADGIVHLVDPFAVPEVRDKLHGIVPTTGLAGAAVPPVNVLLNVLGAVSATPPGERPRYALTLSKFDVMHRLAEVEDTTWRRIMTNPGSAMSWDVPPEGIASVSGKGLTWNMQGADLIGQEIAGVLGLLGETKLLGALQNAPGGAPEYRLFAVSAMGAAPEAARPNPRGITPFRVLDPVTWILEKAWA